MSLPLFIKEYFIIITLIFIGTAIFFFYFKDKTYLRWGLLLFLVITSIYFSMKFLIFAIILFLLILIFLSKQSDLSKVGYYLLLLPLIPINLSYKISFPVIQQSFNLRYTLLLSLFILLPLFLKYISQPEKRIFSYKIDKYIIVFLIFIFILTFREKTFTKTFAIGIFRFFMIYFLPYFVISRTLNKTEDFKKIFYPMIFIAFILALIGIFEIISNQHMYFALSDILGMSKIGVIQTRGGFLRTFGSFGSPIVFGVYLVIMTCFLMFLKYSLPEKFKNYFNIIFFILTIGLVSTISSTPILGYGVFFFIFILLTINKKETIKLTAIFILICLLIFLPLASILLYKGGSAVEYRRILLKNSLKVIEKLPLTGSSTFMYEREMDLPSGSLSVDVTNSYLQIVLRYGLIGVVLYLLIFISSLFNLRKTFLFSKNNEIVLLGKILFSITIAVMVMIFFVSLISFLPIYIWILFGLCSGYIHMVSNNKCKIKCNQKTKT
jgi:hypothetical protein